MKDELDCAVSDEFVSKLASIRVASGTDSKLKVPSCPLERLDCSIFFYHLVYLCVCVCVCLCILHIEY